MGYLMIKEEEKIENQSEKLAEQTEEQTEEQTDKITLNDLGSIKNIINVASRRGAFGAEEFIDIGTVYGKLEKFLQVQVKILEEKVEEEKIEQITLDDLASLRNVINVASRRGAFGV